MADFLNKYYEIDFSDGTRTETLRYQIADTPVSQIWLNCVRYHMQSPDWHIYDNQWIKTYPTLEKVQALWKSMKTLVDDINAGTHLKIDHIDMPSEFDPTIDNRPLLNYLHFEFHRHHENNIRSTRLRKGLDPLSQLNIDVHTLETWIPNLNDKSHTVLSCGFFLYSSRPSEGGNVPIPDTRLYEYWNHDAQFGDFLLGYHTVGKNIFHCSYDNDVDLVKKGFVRPQRTISTETLLHFENHRPGYAAGLTKKGHEWVKNNDLEQYIDLSLPENNVSCHPLLGCLQGNYTKDDINNILELGRVTTVRLVE